VLTEQLDGGLVAAFETNPMTAEGIEAAGGVGVGERVERVDEDLVFEPAEALEIPGGVEKLGEEVHGESVVGLDFGTKPILESFEVLLFVGTDEEGLGVEAMLRLFWASGTCPRRSWDPWRAVR